MPYPIVLKSLLMAFVALVPSLAPAEQAPPELNRAQELVFLGEHLRETRQGQTLIYDFTSRAGGVPVKADVVKMTVTKVVDETQRDLSFEFLSGPDRLHFPDARGYRGNPIAVQFLERDIRDMARQTGTPSAYFRNSIRRSFKTPRIAQTRLSVGDRQVDATEITVVPFTTDSTLATREGYADKQYLFTYSDQVPGDLVVIGTRMSNADGTMLEEELRFRHSTGIP